MMKKARVKFHSDKNTRMENCRSFGKENGSEEMKMDQICMATRLFLSTLKAVVYHKENSLCIHKLTDKSGMDQKER